MDYLAKLRRSAERNRNIKALFIKGWKVTAIAKRHNISRARVYQVLAK